MTNKERYALLCEQEPSICVYDQPWWMDAVCGEENWDVLLCDRKDRIVGALPYYVKKRAGLRYITQPLFTQHNGAWIRYPDNLSPMKRISLEKDILTDLIHQLESLPVCYYQQSFSADLTNWLPFYWKGYQQSTNYTYRLPDIAEPENLLSSFNADKRRNISRARRSGYQIQFDLSPEKFYEHHKKSLAKRGDTISYSLDLFERIHDAAYAHNCGKIGYLTAEDGEVLCAVFNMWDSKWGYDLITAFDPDVRKTGAPDLLVYSMIEYLSDKTKGYDFEGSMIEGVEESFRHFGAIQTPYFNIRKIYTKNPLLRACIHKKMG